MRFDSLVSLFQASRDIDDVKGGICPRVNPDLLQPGQVVQIIWISSSGNCFYNLEIHIEKFKEKHQLPGTFNFCIIGLLATNLEPRFFTPS